MKKKVFLIIGCSLILIMALKGIIYRAVVTYDLQKGRSSFLVSDPELKNRLDCAKLPKEPDVSDIIGLCLSFTSASLTFSPQKYSSDPNVLIASKKSNCIGYACFFATSCNYLLKKHHFDKEWRAKPYVAEIHFMGYNIHHLFSSPFFYDHDCVVIHNKLTGETIAVDPTIHDYFRFGYISVIE